MTSDEGGWTLVASTRNTTLNDQGSDITLTLRRLCPRPRRRVFGRNGNDRGSSDIRYL